MNLPSALRHKLNSRKSKKAPAIPNVPAVMIEAPYVPANYAKPSRAIVSTASEEVKQRWAAEHAVRVELDKKAEKDRKAAYKKRHTPIVGNHAKRTGGTD
jgi:hypothetical protein